MWEIIPPLFLFIGFLGFLLALYYRSKSLLVPGPIPDDMKNADHWANGHESLLLFGGLLWAFGFGLLSLFLL